MDTDIEAHSGPDPPLERKIDAQIQIACDVCYTRKIRCDRKSPCGSCKDARVPCLRERQKIERKSRDLLPKEISEAINEIKGRMSTLESSVSHLISLSTDKDGEIDNSRGHPQKRSRTDFCDKTVSESTLSRLGSCSPHITAVSESHQTPPFSAHEAQKLIQKELNHPFSLNSKKQVAFHSALSSLRQSLNTSIMANRFSRATIPEEALEDLPMPSIALMQWMLQSNDSGRSHSSNTDFMPFTSRKSVGIMAQTLLQKPFNDSQLPSIICVAAYSGYFLQEIILSKGDQTGLEDQLRIQALEYFGTARVAISRLLMQTPATLRNLQALTFGILLEQEAGDFAAAWHLTQAASDICIKLNLHRNINAFIDYPSEVACEAYYCFTVCYKNDKGLAMNLGHPAFLQDSMIEIDLFRLPNSNLEFLDNFRIYLELAQIQSRIVRDLRPAKSGSQRTTVMSNILTRIDYIWELIKESKRRNQEEKGSKYDSEMESTIVDFAFHSVKTVVFHSETEYLRDSEHNLDSLDAARSALSAIQRARELSQSTRYSSEYMRRSFAHW